MSVADLILVQDRVVPTVERLMQQDRPQVVGLSIMTFSGAPRSAGALPRCIDPSITIVAGGDDPSLAPEAYESPDSGVDYLVRGEGELTFRALLRALEDGRDAAGIPGLSCRHPSWAGAGFRHNPSRAVSRLDGDIALPARAARVLHGYTFMGRGIDIVETSRGCTYDCSFCSIIEMRGRNFHRSTSRGCSPTSPTRGRAAHGRIIVDDNITLNVARFEALCRAIVEAGFNDVHGHRPGDDLVDRQPRRYAVPLMRRAGFRCTCSWASRTCSTRTCSSCAPPRRTRSARAGGRRAMRRCG